MTLDLQQSAVMCKNGRLGLRQAKSKLLSDSLAVIAKCRRQQIYIGELHLPVSFFSAVNCMKLTLPLCAAAITGALADMRLRRDSHLKSAPAIAVVPVKNIARKIFSLFHK